MTDQHNQGSTADALLEENAGIPRGRRVLVLLGTLLLLPLLIPLLLCFALVTWIFTDGLLLFMAAQSPNLEDRVSSPHWSASDQIPAWKRVLDVTLIILALPILLPCMVGISLLIWAVSEGPVLFRQQRVGYKGKPFTCLKFRTMKRGADTSIHEGHLRRLMESKEPMTKMDSKGDSRIIPFGIPLRSSGLDELPQIINILRGDMSLVGPRPCLFYEYEKYLPHQKERFNTLPGLTGLWQVNGKNRTTFEEMIQMDIDYTHKKTPWLDLKIIFKTIPALVIQMRETRRGQKTSLPTFRSGASVSASQFNQN